MLLLLKLCEMILSRKARECLEKILVFVPADRLTAAETMKHPYFNEKQERDLDRETVMKLEQFARRGQLQKALFPVMQDHCAQRKAFLNQQWYAINSTLDDAVKTALNFQDFVGLLKKVGMEDSETEMKKVS